MATPQLLSALERCRERLHALPGVVGTGIGIHEGRPVAEIWVSGRADRELERAIREIVDFDFVVIPDSPIPEAQTATTANPRAEED